MGTDSNLCTTRPPDRSFPDQLESAAHRAWIAPIVVALGFVAAGCAGIGPGGPVSNAVVASIPIGDFGTDVAVRADGAQAYVTLSTNRIDVIDTASRTVARRIMTSLQPGAIALTPDGTRGYVMDMLGQSLSVLDTKADRVLTQVPVAGIGRALVTPAVAVSRDGRRAFVTSATTDNDRLLVVDTASSTIVQNQVLKIHPVGVAVSPDGARVYVVGCQLACLDGTLLTIDAATASVVSTLPLPTAPSGIVLSPDGSKAYLANMRDASVGVIDLASSAVTTIPVSPQPVALTLDPAGRRLYVASASTARIDVVDVGRATVAAHLTVASLPRAIAISPDGRFAYVTHAQSTCSVIDLSRVSGP